jgi:HAD superfamily hydrolase (TIGR01549 family)
MQVPAKISCLLFDLDNTLIEIPNTWQYFDELIIDVMAEDFKLPIPCSDQRDQLWRSGKEYIRILKEWGIENHQQFWYLFDKRDGEKRKQFIQQNRLMMYSDVQPVFEQLNQIPVKIGLITNTPHFIAEMELDVFGLKKYFHAIFGLGDDQTMCKPEPEGVFRCLETCQCAAEETLLIGDNQIDILAAKRAGVHPILIDRSEEKKIEHPELNEEDFIRIKNLQEILKWVQNGHASVQLLQ